MPTHIEGGKEHYIIIKFSIYLPKASSPFEYILIRGTSTCTSSPSLWSRGGTKYSH